VTVKKPHFDLRKRYDFKAGDFSLSLGRETAIMGIVNATPDSFSGDGTLKNHSTYRLALRHIQNGAHIIDIGGESSRPGARKVPVEEEIRRIVPLIKKLAKIVKVPISVDTYKGQTAQSALDAGASIINNIQGTKAQKSLLKMVGRYGAGIVLMHMRGTPKTMQEKTHYKNLMADIIRELKIAMENCLENGIKSDNIICDPGIGFAKTAEQNLEIIDRLQELKILRKPILIGTSRKSFIGKILNTDAPDRLIGTITSSVIAINNGAHLLRVHDVIELAQAARVTDAIINRNITKPSR